MNADEIRSLLVKLLLMALTPLATRFGIDGNTTAAISAWLASGFVLAYGVYDHWNMKKVPATATALELPKGVVAPPVGAPLNLAPLSGIAKVVG